MLCYVLRRMNVGVRVLQDANHQRELEGVRQAAVARMGEVEAQAQDAMHRSLEQAARWALV